MKKSFLFAILILFANQLLFAQPACAKEVAYTIASLKQVPKARKIMEEECFPGNESNAYVWLVRGNVFIQLFDYELDRKEKDAKYVIRWPDAIVTANESFYKAIELNPDIKPTDGLLDAKDGQVLSADIISILAAKSINQKDYVEAIKLLNMVIRSYRVDPRKYAVELSYAYFDLATCYKAMDDDANYKKILLDAANLNVAIPDIYLNLYDLYKKEKDTVKCAEILIKARKAVPDSLAFDIKSYELDYFAMLGDTTKFKNAAIKMIDQYKGNPSDIIIIATRLVNNKEYELAEEIINEGLTIASDDFDLIQQMTYRFFYEAIDYNNIVEEQKQLRKFSAAEVALNKANEILESALIWAEKGYSIFQDDRSLNIMFSQILARLGKTAPEGLKEKVDSYYQKQ